MQCIVCYSCTCFFSFVYGVVHILLSQKMTLCSIFYQEYRQIEFQYYSCLNIWTNKYKKNIIVLKQWYVKNQTMVYWKVCDLLKKIYVYQLMSVYRIFSPIFSPIMKVVHLNYQISVLRRTLAMEDVQLHFVF